MRPLSVLVDELARAWPREVDVPQEVIEALRQVRLKLERDTTYIQTLSIRERALRASLRAEIRATEAMRRELEART